MGKRKTKQGGDGGGDSPDAQPVRFEQAIEQIEAVIEQIESGEVGLEQSLAEYERATKLIGRCRGILDTAQKRIAELTTDTQGQLRVAGDGDEGSGDE